MAASDYKDGKKNKQQKKREKEREARRLKKRDSNVLSRYGKSQEVEVVQRLRYRVLLVRTQEKRKNRRYADITGIVESLSWQEEGVMLQGDISLIKPRPVSRGDRQINIGEGNLIKLEAKYAGRWRNVWTMRVQSTSIDLGGDTTSLTLSDDIFILTQTKGDFKFKKDKEKRPKGWKAHQIAREVADEFDIPLGHIEQGDEWLDNINLDNVSPLEPITKAYKQEMEASGKRFIMSYRHGKLSITPLRRNKNLWVLRNQILAATITRQKDEKFFTALRLVGHVKGEKDADKRKIDVVLEHDRAVRRFGKIIEEYKLDSPAESKEKAIIKGKRRLARSIMKATQPTISITHVGMPWVRRGDAMQVNLPEYGYKNKPRPSPPFDGGHYSVIFVTSVSHSIDSTGHTMDLEFTITDPIAEQMVEIRKIRDKERRKK
jgi:hypothetical protein